MTDTYEIRVEGYLGLHWSEWLGGMEIALLESGETLLWGSIPDQVALQDLLAKVRDLNLTLVSIARHKEVT